MAAPGSRRADQSPESTWKCALLESVKPGSGERKRSKGLPARGSEETALCYGCDGRGGEVFGLRDGAVEA